MFTKKNLGPVACAACEKNLINIEGLRVDYHVWKGLPARETNERIARYGQGFSKILSTLRDDYANQTTSGTMMHGHQHDKMTLHQFKKERDLAHHSSIDVGSGLYNQNSSGEINTTKATNYYDERNHSITHPGVHHEISANTTIGFFRSGQNSSKH